MHTLEHSYYGLRDPDNYNPESNTSGNQSCPVSGESGAGKTVACGFIMKYLAKLSDWRLAELGKTKNPDEKDITSLVAGVSPFLEGFGNAKTTMNDNSSRFGKFTKILFNDGMIVGAEMDCYLLEKARLVDQGEHERNYHVFYGLIKGATAEEQAKYKFNKVEDYDMLMHGHTPVIEHETKADGSNTYDADRMNNPLAKDPDDTGFRAAFKNAQVDEAAQCIIWDAIAGMLKLSQLRFEACKNDKGEDASKVVNTDVAKEIETLWGIKDLAGQVVLYKLDCAGTIVWKPMTPGGSNDNRNALLKAYYGHIFDWLFDGVANVVLKPEGSDEGFVGLLDIFGFEVFKKNSIEQLCINFANEKLQQMFNRHTFTLEEKTYEDEGIEFKHIEFHDSQPLLNMLGLPAKGKKLRHSIYGCLDDITSTNQTDDKFLGLIKTRFGKKKKLLSTRLKSRTAFKIFHYAGGVVYDSVGFVKKNADKLYDNLEGLMQEAENKLVCEAFGGNNKKGKRSNSGKGRSKAKVNTAGGNFVKQLKALERT